MPIVRIPQTLAFSAFAAALLASSASAQDGRAPQTPRPKQYLPVP